MISKRQEYSTFGRQVGYVIAANVVTLAVGLIQIPIMTKALGASLYGVWSLITVTVSLITPIAMLNYSMSIVRFLAAEKDTATVRDDFLSACCTVFAAGVILSFLLFALSEPLATFISKEPAAATYIRLGSILVLLNALQTLPLAFFRMQRKMGKHALVSIAQQVILIGAIVLFISLGYQLKGVIVAYILSYMLFTLATFAFIVKEIGFRLPTFSNTRKYLEWGVPMIPNSAMLWIISVSDRYMVSYFLGIAATGIYSAAYSIGNYASFLLMPLQTVIYPYLVKKYEEGDLQETARYLKHSIKYLLMISIPAAFGLSVLGKPLLLLLTTNEFIEASAVIPLVSAGLVMYCFYQLTINVLLLVNKTRLIIYLLGTAALLNIVLNLILLPLMGVMGAAVATLVAYAALGILTLMVARRHLRFDLDSPAILKSLVASTAMALCIWLLEPHSVIMVAASIVLGAVVYFAVLILIRGLDKSELQFFWGLAQDNLRKMRVF